MKKIILLGCMLIIAMSCKAQTIVPVEKSIDYMLAQKGIPKNTYLKDINHLLDKYLGTWKGSYGGKNYTFIITKFKDDFLGVSEDKLRVWHLITSINGVVIEDTRNSLTTDPYTIEGYYFTKGATYYTLNYSGKNSECGNHGTLFIRMKNTTNTLMSVTFEPDKIMMSEDTCPGLKYAELTFPKNDVIRLTKQ